ncbi:MAB_1171c family putative transporter [Saccharopolyspora sp. SCSIO 74807]|uniref:MAB_1171c family putative transporter n=1 Tax=Saccharopolyspora sp. SCSIO 74807 TaxID=3118084 RepID=UPI0030CF7B83
MSLTSFLAFIVAPAWFIYRLARNPGSAALRAVVACLILRAADSPAVMAAIRNTFNLGPTAENLVKNYALASSWCCLMLFFLFAAGAGARRAWREAAILASVLVIMTVAVALTPNPDALLQSSATVASERYPTVLVFYVLGNAYFAYATGAAALWAVRYARESTRRTRFGLLVASVGLAGFAGLSAVRTVLMVLPHSPALSGLVNDLIGPFLLLFVIGVCMVGAVERVVAACVWWRHRRVYSELRPLWQALHDVFPSNALERRRPLIPWLDRLVPVRLHRRYWRRLIECRDGLVKLSPHLVDIGLDSQRPDRITAEQFREALRREKAGVVPGSRHATLVAAPPEDDGADADADELRRLSRSLEY